MPKGGVYAIQNLENGRMYVGSSNNITRRWHEHRSMLYRHDHVCYALQAEWDLYGQDAFVFVVLALSEMQPARIVLEQHFIDTSASPYNTNERAGSGPKAGYSHSDATRHLISQKNTGRKRTVEAKARIAASRRGMKLSDAHKAAIGAAGRGRKHSEETKAKMRAAHERRRMAQVIES